MHAISDPNHLHSGVNAFVRPSCGDRRRGNAARAQCVRQGLLDGGRSDLGLVSVEVIASVPNPQGNGRGQLESSVQRHCSMPDAR